MAAKYNIKLKAPKKEEESQAAAPLQEEQEDEDLKVEELKRGWKYFLYHHHTLLSVLCVHHAADLPRYARLFLFFFDLLCNLMFAMALRESGMAIAERIFLTVFLCLIISFMMAIIFRNCGFNSILSGSGCFNKSLTISILMVIPAAICGSVTVVYMLRQPDNGQEAGIIFCISTVVSSIVEILIWYLMYDCCKAYCSCFLCCCPNLLDDAEVAAADLAHQKKKRERARMG